jgi:hypothetical protein
LRPIHRCNHQISICRKTAGGGGYAINLGADANTLQIEGEKYLSVYNAKLYDPQWPDLVHPFSSAVDTPLPKPPERVHAALEFAAPWCIIPEGENERRFALWPEESIAQWPSRHGLEHP